MSHPSNRNSGTIQGSQNNVNGSYHDNSHTDRSQTYHHYSAPTNNYSTTAYGSNVVNGNFSGVQYNAIPPQWEDAPNPPFLPASPGTFTQEPDEIEDVTQLPAGAYWGNHHPRYCRRSQADDDDLDLFGPYDQPSANVTSRHGSHNSHSFHPRPSSFHPAPEGFPPQMPRGYPHAYSNMGGAHPNPGAQTHRRRQPQNPLNQNYRSWATGNSLAPDPVPHVNHHPFTPGHSEHPPYDRDAFDSVYQEHGSDTHRQEPNRREPNRHRRGIEAVRPKAMGYYQ